MSQRWDVIVVGAGAAGLLAAIRSAESGAKTLLLEKQPRPGTKILMSGGTRCNVTHSTDIRGIVRAFGAPGKFLFSALSAFGPADILALLDKEGVPTKVEETGKVFPVSDRAADVLNALLARLDRSGATLVLGEPLLGLEREGDEFILKTSRRTLRAGRVILTPGGKSYPRSGTSGDGYAWAANLGHTIISPRPSLTPITSAEKWVKTLQGLAVPDVELTVLQPLRGQSSQAHRELQPLRGQSSQAHPEESSQPVRGQSSQVDERSISRAENASRPPLGGQSPQEVERSISRTENANGANGDWANGDCPRNATEQPTAAYEDCPRGKSRGSFLFTHFGVSGSAVLDISRVVSGHPGMDRLRLRCDFLPDLSLDGLVGELNRRGGGQGRRQVSAVVAELLPRRLAEAVCDLAEVPRDRRFTEVSKTLRRRLAEQIKATNIPISGVMGFQKAEVTAGGVCLDEVDSRTMESKLTPGLYFAGEILDLDGPIGGYNFQAAFSTGWLAGSLRS